MCIVDGVCYKYNNYIYKSIIHPASEAWALDERVIYNCCPGNKRVAKHAGSK